MDENGKDLAVEQNKTKAVKGQLDVANQSINSLKAVLQKFGGVDIDGLKTKISDWWTKYNTDIRAERTKTENVKKDFALKEALKKTGVAGCLVVGYLVKNFMPNDNKWIPLIVTMVGILIACWSAKSVEAQTIIAGAVTGLASTGLHQAFKQLINKDEK